MLWNKIASRLTGHVVSHVTAEQRKPGNLLDARMGFAMLRDKGVPVAPKLYSLGLGIALTYALEALEMPVEAIVAALVPGLGLAGDMMMDGAEAVICPVLFASLLLPHLAPRRVTVEARAVRRNGLPGKR